MHDNKELWYRQPARYWEEALPLGNGRLGAMLFSGVEEDVLMINEDTLWSGYPKDTIVQDAYVHYQKARDLALEKRYEEAEREIEENLTGEFTDSYLPLGKVCMRFPAFAQGVPDTYERSLQLRTAQVLSHFRQDGVTVEKEAFISVPDQALFWRITANRAKVLDFSIRVQSDLKSVSQAGGNRLLLTGIAPSYDAPGYLTEEEPVIYRDNPAEKGMRFCMIVSVETEDGRVEAGEEQISVAGASWAVVRICAGTSFRGFDKHPFLEGKDELGDCLKDMERAERISFDEAAKKHLAEYGELFGSMDLHLETPEVTRPTDERIRSFYPKAEDTGLYELFFHYGRYLLIASSRPGTQPVNLQGIWNARVRPSWSSNYTVNINTQMNYWPAEICGLSPLHEPLFRLIGELQKTGSRTAAAYYGAGGFVSHHNVDIWRLSTPVGRKGRGTAGYAFWPMSSGWLCRHLYEHYEYTLDKGFLRDTAYPLIREAAVFYRDVLMEDGGGRLVFAPSISPENHYLKDGFRGAVTTFTAMGTAIIWEVFTECIRCAEILGAEDALTEELREKRERLAPLQIGADGRILEWNEELMEAEPQHRHISHMYALYPGEQVFPPSGERPELIEAFRRSLEGRGDAGTGWSESWKMNAWARLGDAEHVMLLLNGQLKYVPPGETEENSDNFNYVDGGGVYPNLFDAHPPFQIDGNFGTTAAIAELFLQSTQEAVWLLPALPRGFGRGWVKGIRAKGRIRADIRFADGRLEEAVLYTDTMQDRILYREGKRERIHLEPGIPFAITPEKE